MKTIIMKLEMRKVKTVLMATLVLGLTAGLTACGSTENTETDGVKTEEEHPASTNEEHPASENEEHPASEEGEEHPAEDNEHPAN